MVIDAIKAIVNEELLMNGLEWKQLSSLTEVEMSKNEITRHQVPPWYDAIGRTKQHLCCTATKIIWPEY